MLLVLTVVFFRDRCDEAGSFFLLVHFIQILYICSRYEMPWPPWFLSFFRFLGDFAMPLILCPSFVETLAINCVTYDTMLNPLEEFATHMMALPASCDGIIYIPGCTGKSCLSRRFHPNRCCGLQCSLGTRSPVQTGHHCHCSIPCCGKQNRDSHTR